MPKSKKSDLTGVVMWAVIIALVAGMFWGAGFETLEKWQHPAQNGVPNVFQEDREYWSRVNSPIVAGNRLYLLFDALQLVKVYDLQGNYLYTVNMTNKNQELLCRGWFLPPNTYDCGSFVVNGTAVVGKEQNNPYNRWKSTQKGADFYEIHL